MVIINRVVPNLESLCQSRQHHAHFTQQKLNSFRSPTHWLYWFNYQITDAKERNLMVI